MLAFLTVVIMLIVAYAYLGEGVFTACIMCLNVFLAGLVAFNFWEPIAEALDPMLEGSFLQGYVDALCMIPLFALTLGMLRLATNSLANAQIAFPTFVQRSGAVLFGLATGYLVAGFLVCVFQTLPWHENFISYDPRPRQGMGRVLPADRVWLATMRRAGAYAFANRVDPSFWDETDPDKRYMTFDKYGSFVPRYTHFRRYTDKQPASPYQGECDAELYRGR